jgi:hypothetical protein
VAPDAHRWLGERVPALRYRNVMFSDMTRSLELVDWLPSGADPVSEDYRPGAELLTARSLGYGDARMALMRANIPVLLRLWCERRSELDGVLLRTRRFDLAQPEGTARARPVSKRFERCAAGRLVPLDGDGGAFP